MIVYTCITHGRDKLREQPLSLDVVPHHAFVDSEQTSKTWFLHRIERDAGKPSITSKKFKVFPHLSFSQEEYTLWIDGSIEIMPMVDLVLLSQKFLIDADIAVFRHQSRTCAYQEAAVCIGRKLDDSATIQKQIFRYTQEGYPANNGLSECSVILRRNTPRMKEFNELWWHEITNGSIRDQISFDYCAWKLKMPVAYFPGTVRFFDNELFLRCR